LNEINKHGYAVFYFVVIIAALIYIKLKLLPEDYMKPSIRFAVMVFAFTLIIPAAASAMNVKFFLGQVIPYKERKNPPC
jgi:hypothetical protein